MANNLFIDFLPPWVETGVQPAFYDKESGTVLQQTARMYEKVNEVVQSVNNQNTTIDDYIGKFNELHDYVYDYFDNLDVQEEINNKLDQMFTDGQLAPLVDNYLSYIDSEMTERFGTQDTIISTAVTEINNTLSQQNGNIDALESRMDSFTSLEEGSTTGDAELIDGRTSFTGRVSANIGGNIRTYQGCKYRDITSTLTKVSDKYVTFKEYIDGVKENAVEGYEYYTLPTVKGKKYLIDVRAGANAKNIYIGYRKSIPDYSTSVATSSYPIEVMGTGMTLLINNYLTNYSTPYIGEEITDGVLDELTEYYNDITETMTETSGKYIYKTGVQVTNAHASFYTFTPKAGHYYIIKSAYGGDTPLAYQDGTVFPYLSDAGYSTDYLQNQFKIYSTSTATMKVNCLHNRMASDFKIYESKLAYNTTNAKYKNYLYSSPSIFEKVGVIGDSFAVGWLDGAPEGHKERKSISWCNIMARKCGFTCTTFAKGGLSTRTWLTSDQGLTLMNATEAQELYMIALGINDIGQINENLESLGTIADIDLDNPDSNPNTFYGNYGKILSAIKTKSADAKVVLITIPKVNTGDNKMINDAIIEIAETFSLPIIVSHENTIFTSDYFENEKGSRGHPTVAGYGTMAEAYEMMLEECIATYYNYFKDYLGSEQ